MNKMAILNRIKKAYQTDNVNIIKYLREIGFSEEKTVEDIMISYDFQAGSYIKEYKENPSAKFEFMSRLAQIIRDLGGESIFEAGIGEATSFVALMKLLNRKFEFSGGGDISWSRVKTALNFVNEEMPDNKSQIVIADMFCLPFADSSIDIVYTIHSLEPNGGHERELLEELYRVAGEYIILLEPAYELADTQSRKRMEEHGYIRELYKTAKDLGYNILTWELYGVSVNPLNPTGLMIIQKKDIQKRQSAEFACPITKTKLEKIGNAFFSHESLLAYPIVNDVACLTREHAVVATKMDSIR